MPEVQQIGVNAFGPVVSLSEDETVVQQENPSLNETVGANTKVEGRNDAAQEGGYPPYILFPIDPALSMRPIKNSRRKVQCQEREMS